MIERWSRPLDARWGVPIAALAVLLLLAALAPSPASAVPATGQARITPQPGKAKTDLFEQGAQLQGIGKGRTITLEVTDLSFGKVTKASTADTIVFVRGKKKVVVRDVDLRVATKRVALAGKIGKDEFVVLRATGRSESVANSIGLRNAPLALTGKAAKALAPRLGLDAIKPGRLGLLRLSATQNDLPKAAQQQPGQSQAQSEQPKPDDPTPTPDPCDIGVSSTGDWTAPSLLPAPGLDSPADVTGGSVDWTFKSSLRGYVMSGGAVVPVSPATVPAPPMGAFDFPVSSGAIKFDASGGLAEGAVIDGSGEVKLCHTAHKFSIYLSNPTVTLDGEDSRLTVDVETNMSGVHTPKQRVDLATLDLDEIVPFYSENTKTSAWKDVPVILTEAGSEALQLCSPENPGPCDYQEGDALEPISFEVRTGAQLAWPYNVGCDLSGIANMPQPVVTNSWPELPAGPAALPTLSAPEAIGEGSISWGLRTSLRNSVNATGVFNLADGAEKTEANMSGTGKSFTWPSTSGEYQPAGGGNPERLVLRGTGIVGICQSHFAQAYGTVLSDPTLVLDGEDSRLTVTISSRYRYSWTSGRVDIANLDIAAVERVAVPGSGEETITWTFPDPGADDTASGATETNSSVTLTPAGTSGLWLLGTSTAVPPPPSPYKTAGTRLNPVSVSIVRPIAP